MSNLTAKFAGIATLALAILPVAALSTAAHAAPGAQRVQVGDLDLGSNTGIAKFDARVRRASHQMCGSEIGLGGRDACETAVRAEAREKLAAVMGLHTARFAVR